MKDVSYISNFLRTREQTRCLVLLSAIVVFCELNTLTWLWIDTRPPRWDEAHYLTMSLQYHLALASDGVMSLIKSLLTVDRMRPPLVPALAMPMYFLFGKSADAALAVNLVAFLVLILATYGLGARLASPRVGVLAAFLVSTYPAAFGLARLFLLDFCDIALVAMALYLLMRTAGFSRKRPSLAFGVVVGLGLLTRAFFPIFLIGPLGVSAYMTWRRARLSTNSQKPGQSRVSSCGGLALLACALVAAPWYLINVGPLVLRSFSAAYGAEAVGYGPATPWTLHAMLSYLIIFINVPTTLAGVGSFLLGGMILYVKRARLFSQATKDAANPVEGLLILISSGLIPYGVFSTLPSQDLKNIVPVLPAMAVISAWGLSLLEPVALRKAVIGFVTLVSLCQVWLGTYGVATLSPAVGLRLGTNLPALLVYRQATTLPDEGFLLLPRQEDWRVPDILSFITEKVRGPDGTRNPERPAVVAVVPDHALFNSNNFQYFAELEGLPIRTLHPGDPRWPEGKDYRTQLLKADIAVVKTSDPGQAWLNSNNADMIKFLRSSESGFVELLPRFPLPDGSQAMLYAARAGLDCEEGNAQ